MLLINANRLGKFEFIKDEVGLDLKNLTYPEIERIVERDYQLFKNLGLTKIFIRETLINHMNKEIADDICK